MKRIKVFYHPGFAAPIGQHTMPMNKFSEVAKRLATNPDVELVEPIPATLTDILRVHSQDYVKAVQTGEPRPLAESQKFPWSPQLLPSVLLTNGAVIAASRQALQDGYSAALASGFHHSHRERGEGFCTFNGLVVALEALRQEGLVQRPAILDLDLHYGNGTALLARERPWFRVLSLYGNDYWNNTPYRDVSIRQHEDGPNFFSAALPAGCDASTLFRMMDENLPILLQGGKPDLLLYQAGADPYYEDPYSPLQLDHDALLKRDEKVFQWAKAHQIPIAWVLAGGYTKDLSKVIQVHTNTFEAWKNIFHG